MATKIAVSSNLGIIGVLSPYSYQVKPKTWADREFVVWEGKSRKSRLTKGAGKGAVTRYYAYFLEEDFLHWIELTADAYATIEKDPAAKLELTAKKAEESKAEESKAEEPKAEEPKAEEPAPKKGKRASREKVAAE